MQITGGFISGSNLFSKLCCPRILDQQTIWYLFFVSFPSVLYQRNLRTIWVVTDYVFRWPVVVQMTIIWCRWQWARDDSVTYILSYECRIYIVDMRWRWQIISYPSHKAPLEMAASSRCHIAIFLLCRLCGVLGRVMTEKCTAVHWSDFVFFWKLYSSDSKSALFRFSCKMYFWDIVISSFVSMPLGWRWPRDALVVRPWPRINGIHCRLFTPSSPKHH